MYVLKELLITLFKKNIILIDKNWSQVAKHFWYTVRSQYISRRSICYCIYI